MVMTEYIMTILNVVVQLVTTLSPAMGIQLIVYQGINANVVHVLIPLRAKINIPTPVSVMVCSLAIGNALNIQRNSKQRSV